MHGAVCPDCPGTAACKLPAAAIKARLDCPACGGRGAAGCPMCGGRGRIDVAGCPRVDVPRNCWDVIAYADLFERGLPPDAGGVLDQAANFVEAARYVWACKARYERDHEP